MRPRILSLRLDLRARGDGLDHGACERRADDHPVAARRAGVRRPAELLVCDRRPEHATPHTRAPGWYGVDVPKTGTPGAASRATRRAASCRSRSPGRSRRLGRSSREIGRGQPRPDLVSVAGISRSAGGCRACASNCSRARLPPPPTARTAKASPHALVVSRKVAPSRPSEVARRRAASARSTSARSRPRAHREGRPRRERRAASGSRAEAVARRGRHSRGHPSPSPGGRRGRPAQRAHRLHR